jgi:aryl-alcohol dehydrogenase (NADP+)
MKYNKLPGTELTVSEGVPRHDDLGRAEHARPAHEQLDYAVAHGINFIDTAEMYPGAAQRAHAGTYRDDPRPLARQQQRDKLIVATKVAGPGRRDWIRSGRTDLTRDVIEEACGTSLARLRTDYIDLFQIHWPQRNVPQFGAVGVRSREGARRSFDSRAGRGMAASSRRARSATTACPTRRRGACASSIASRASSACRDR